MIAFFRVCSSQLSGLLCALLFSFASATIAADNKPPSILIENAYIKLPVPGHSMAAGYFTINNQTDSAITLLSASHPEFTIQMHNSETKHGNMQMQHLHHVSIEAKQQRQFQPRGMHLMIMSWQSTELKSVPITLHFDDGSEQTINFELRNW